MMESVEDIISSLNDLYVLFIETNRDPVTGKWIREKAYQLQQKGFSIRQADRDPAPGEAALLTARGRKALQELADIQQKKTEAIANGEFEHAADLRKMENQLRGALWERIIRQSSRQFFILSENEQEIIVFGHWPVH